MQKTLTPKYYPRAQFTGLLRWTCVYCAHVNQSTLRPTAFKAKCKACGNMLWFGVAMHIPAGSKTTIAKDSTIPTWAGDEYSFDPLPKAFFDPSKTIKQRGRIGVMIIHENVYTAEDELPISPEEAEPYQ